jgi:hypothetical protein
LSTTKENVTMTTPRAHGARSKKAVRSDSKARPAANGSTAVTVSTGSTAVDTGSTLVEDPPTEVLPPMVTTEEIEAASREERRRLERTREADEKALRWQECEEAARMGVESARSQLEEAQRRYDEASSESARIGNQLRLDRDGYGVGFWKVVCFIRTTAGAGDGDDDKNRYDRIMQAEADLIEAKRSEQVALFNLKVCARHFRISRKMTAHYRMRHYNLSDQGYHRAALWFDIKRMAWTPLRLLWATAVGLGATVVAAVGTVASAIGVVAVGAVALVVKGFQKVKGFFSWIGSKLGGKRHEPAPEPAPVPVSEGIPIPVAA